MSMNCDGFQVSNTVTEDATDQCTQASSSSSVALYKQQPGVLSRLPVEVLVQFIELLSGSFLDILAVTHVCSVWRDAATGHKILWTKIDLNKRTFFTHAEMTSEFLRRSGDLPVDIYIYTQAPGLVPLMEQNMHRFSRIYTEIPLEYWLFNKPTPNLVSIQCDNLRLPEHWGGHLVPNLRELVVDTLRVPESFSAVPAMRSLWCDGPVNLPKIRKIFPCLEILNIRRLSDHDQTNLPPTLVELALSTDRDISHYLTACPKLRRLKLKGYVGTTMSSFFATAVGSGSWSLTLERSGCMVFSSLSGREFQLSIRDPFDFSLIRGAAHTYPAAISQITALTISSCAAQRFYLGEVTFDAVTDIRYDMHIETRPKPSHWHLAIFVKSPFSATISAPNLRRLIFEEHGTPTVVRSDPEATVQIISSLVTFPAQRMEGITVISRNARFASCDWTAQLRHTKRIVLQHPVDGVLREIL